MRQKRIVVFLAFLVAITLVLSACGGEDLPEGEPTGTNHDSINPGGEPVSFVNPTAVDVDNYAFANNDFITAEQTIFDLPIINEFDTQNGARRPLRGEFTVSDAGDPSYTLMIDLPPAIAGFTPELGFRYTGSTEIGSLRNGWSMIGYSEIAKCPATKRVDGFIGTVKGSAHDEQRFCLDGEPLILVSGSAYGANGSEYVTQKKSLSRIKAFGSADSGPEYFELKTGGGVTKIFGQAKDATVMGDGVYTWKIDKVIDPSGNEIDYEYSFYRLPMFIYYQGKADGERSVRVYFAWETTEKHLINRDSFTPQTVTATVTERLDNLGNRYSLGDDLYSDPYRLEKIQVAVGYRNNLAYDESYYYHFEYGDHLMINQKGLPPKSLLKKIFRCQDTTKGESEPQCAKPVVFEWGYDYQRESKWDRCDLSSEKMWPGGAQYFSGEYVSSHPLTDDFGWSGGNYYSHVLADFNNDDNVDIAVIYTVADGGNSRMNAWIAYANGDGTYRDSGTRFSEIIGGSGIINHRLAGDVNNDGLADLIAMNASQGGWNAYMP